MAHKRNASAAELNERNAKLDAALVTSGRAPPPNPFKDVHKADFAGHEKAWLALFRRMQDNIATLIASAEESVCETFLRTERAAFACPSVDVGAVLDDVKHLVWVENDHPDDIWESVDDTCVCCNRMEESWRHMGRNGFDVEPRWRIIGSSKFVCRWCYDQLSAGKTCKIML
jgi:hypothetical protein